MLTVLITDRYHSLVSSVFITIDQGEFARETETSLARHRYGSQHGGQIELCVIEYEVQL